MPEDLMLEKFIRDASQGGYGDVCISCQATPDYDSYETLEGYLSFTGVGLLCSICSQELAGNIFMSAYNNILFNKAYKDSEFNIYDPNNKYSNYIKISKERDFKD